MSEVNKMEFLNQIRQSSKLLHSASEHSGFIKRIIDKEATKEGYGEYLYNLGQMYEAIEKGLLENREDAIIKEFVTPELHRSGLIAKDVAFILAEASNALKPLASTVAFKQRIEEIKQTEPVLLIAHAYTRFMADLFGGRTFFQLFNEHYQIPAEGLHYYTFPDIQDIRGYAMSYAARLGQLQLSPELQVRFINEVNNAYIYNLALSNELEAQLSQEPSHRNSMGHPHHQ